MSVALQQSSLSKKNKIARGLWGVAYVLLFRPSPRPFFAWRRLLLRMFGASVQSSALIYSSARIWAPWQLRMEAGSCLGDFVDCYNVAPVQLKQGAVVSQYSFLCTATHDFDDPAHPLMTAPITLERRSWVAADVFVAPGVTIAEGSVVLARSTVLKDTEAWMVLGGVPLRKIRERRFEV
ncbi:putative colanic acid biosynthesis acetyltransferase [Coraliomargarita sinensis]|uniref:Putative colanic acid biosynthesis acetyltransferase n=1 Tax=Coraliomargarita sinensis TaxID=2174842 RepID=A0A317ZJY5_9BACT|nr:putative colanic acid biosynthesis acetyltransferase [Coraliomargarita sinensis]PXA03671.1 putative colanic acid biosynthesis acetyltransferase [Coraliomargarita sinensis]